MTDYYFTLQLHITNRCNLNCPYCYHFDHGKHGNLKLEDYYDILENFITLCKQWDVKPNIIFAGGEPFANKDFEKICDFYSKSSDFGMYAVLSNGTLITQDRIESLKHHNIRFIQISLDGYNEETHDLTRGVGSFNKTIDGIRVLQTNNIPVSVNVVLSYRTNEYIDHFFRMAERNNIKRITFGRLVPIGMGNTEISSMLSPQDLKVAYQKIYDCSQAYGIETNFNDGLFSLIKSGTGKKSPAGFTATTVYDDGNILPSSRIPLTIGNIKETNLDEVWLNHPFLNDLRDKTTHECSGCEYFEECGGGDEEVNFAYWGKFHRTDPQCWLKYKELPKMPEGKYSNFTFDGRYMLAKDEHINVFGSSEEAE